jgi:hypothetical protein
MASRSIPMASATSQGEVRCNNFAASSTAFDTMASVGLVVFIPTRSVRACARDVQSHRNFRLRVGLGLKQQAVTFRVVISHSRCDCFNAMKTFHSINNPVGVTHAFVSQFRICHARYGFAS